jgi:hypothetical protein
VVADDALFDGDLPDEDGKAQAAFDPWRCVVWSSELDRIVRLPRRPTLEAPDLTQVYRRRNSWAQLRPFQSACLWNLPRALGLVALGGVGSGKTLVGLLAQTALQVRRAVYFTTAQLQKQVIAVDHPRWAKDFILPPLGDLQRPGKDELFVVSYEMLSSVKQADILERLRPDLAILDEAHKVRSRTSARTKRLIRYWHEINPACLFVVMSGTLSAKSPVEYAHLLEMALRGRSPLPNVFQAYPQLKEWAEALETPKPGILPAKPGALALLGTDEEVQAMARLDATSQPAARAAYRRRLIETPGVVATSQSEFGGSLILTAIRPPLVPELEDIRQRIRDVERDWKIGDDEIEYAPRLWSVLRQLSMGFYYEWVWPDGVKDEEWLQARSDWYREVREMLSGSPRAGMDTPFFLAQAAESGRWHSTAWAAWKRVKDRPPPATRPVWFSDFAIREVWRWLQHRDQEPGLIWYEHTAVGERLGQQLNLPVAGAGAKGASTLMECVAKRQTCVLSINAHREGKNLQSAFSQNFMMSPPPSAMTWEQTIGRTHRPGQEADEVVMDALAHTTALEDALVAALLNAKYLEEMQQATKILFATRIGWPDIDAATTRAKAMANAERKAGQ